MKKWIAKSLIRVITILDPKKIILTESISDLKKELHTTLTSLLEIKEFLIEYERTKNDTTHNHHDFIQERIQWLKDEEAKYIRYQAEIVSLYSKITLSFAELRKFSSDLKHLKTSILQDIKHQKQDNSVRS